MHNIDPVLLSLGPLEIRYYGLVYVIGFVLVYFALLKKRKELNIEKDDVESLVTWLILGTIIGARAFEVFVWNPSYYLAEPWNIFAVWKGGMSLHGGILGVAAAGFYFCKKHDIKKAKIADILVMPAAFALALGRIANFINAEIVGTITSVSWCFKFPSYEGCRHPVQLYAAAGRFMLFSYLVILERMNKWKDGFIFWNFVFLMGIGRFFLDFIREDPRFFGLSTGQYLSMAMAVIGAYVLLRYYSSEVRKNS